MKPKHGEVFNWVKETNLKHVRFQVCDILHKDSHRDREKSGSREGGEAV